MTLPRRSLLATPALLLAGQAQTQEAWPERPVRFIVPFPAGSTPDTTGRAVATHYAKVFGQPAPFKALSENAGRTAALEQQGVLGE